MNRPISVAIPHQLGAAEAKRRIEDGFARLAEQIAGPGVAQVTRHWDGGRMTFSVGALGQNITGQLLVLADQVQIEVLLPGLLGTLAQAIRGRLERQGRLLLGKKGGA